jgi:serine protease Do
MKLTLKKCKYTVWLVGISLLLMGTLRPFSSVGAEEAQTPVIQQISKEFTRIAERTNPAVVFIQVEKTAAGGPMMSPFDQFDDDFFERFFGNRLPRSKPPEEHKQRGWGSGFIISKDGYILTNHHVVGDADKISVQLKDEREFEAKVVGTDSRSDIALIRIEDSKELPVLPLGDSDSLAVGELVMAIGSPFGLSHTMTVGVVSAKGRTTVGIADYEDFIQTDAAINPGNSGGPLINMNGEAVGINTAIFSRSGGYMGIGFAIPINMVKAIKEQLVEQGEVRRGYLGMIIQDLSSDLKESFDLKETDGVLVADVKEDSPAEKAGLKRGDVVISFDGKTVKDAGRLRNMVALTTPETEVQIVVIRNEKKKKLTASLGTLKEKGGPAPAREDSVQKLGLAVQDLTDDLAERFGYHGQEGVIISAVEPDGPAQLAGLRPGTLLTEVNREAISSTKEFFAALGNLKEPKNVLLLVQEGPHSRYVVLPLE